MGTRLKAGLASFVLVIVVAIGARAEAPKVLRVSAIPDENPQELLRKYEPFTKYLSQELGIPVKFVPVIDYAATVEGLAGKKLDIVWYGGFTSVQAVRRTGGKATRLAMRKEDAEFKSVFVTRPDTGIKKLSDLKGKTFSFGSVSSTSGHLMPRYFLLKKGINPDNDFAQKPAFSGAHDATALWVEGGKVDAGALNFLVWEKLAKNKKIDTKKVNVFWTTPSYVDYVWVARSGIDPDLRERFTVALLKLDYNNPKHREILDLQRTKGFVRAHDTDWKGIEGAAKAAGLLK
ncbi:MAG: putative selenate ABC transporter substrate-binding protein [Candidatus Methylomirabilales bacterium]